MERKKEEEKKEEEGVMFVYNKHNRTPAET